MFVASLVIGLVVASEWARRLAIRGMCEATGGGRGRARCARREGGATPSLRHGLARCAWSPLRPQRADDAEEVVPIPQWQRDP